MPEEAGKSTPKGWTALLPRLRSAKGILAWAGLCIALDALLTLCRPWPLKVVIDRVIIQPPRISRVPMVGEWLHRASLEPSAIIYGAGAAVLIVALGTGFFTYAFTRAMGEVGRRLLAELRQDLFSHLQGLSLRFHDQQRTGDLTARLTTDVHSIQDVLSNGLVILFSNGFLLAGMVRLMFWLDWRFALVALSMAPLLFWAVFRSTQNVKAAARDAHASDGLLASLAQETFASIRIVQGLAQEEQQSQRFLVQNQASLQATLEGLRYQARIAPLVDLLTAAGLALVIGYGARGVLEGSLTDGDVVVFFAYVTNLYSPMKALAKLSYSFNRASVGAERIAEMLGQHSDVVECPGALPAPRLRGAIKFEGVSFEYEKGRPVLQDVHLSIAVGEKVALVGPTGAGKTTLASLIPRFYDPGSGRVALDGHDIRSFQLRSLRRQISLVLQDSLLFRGTIYENIAFGRTGASEAEVRAAAEVAYADEFISKLPEGYQTLVTERGSSLSGGQKQRIAIARAVLRDSPILILDEPTSGLDVASEDVVVRALEQTAKGRTTLVIAHRFSTLRFMDRIIVIDRGRILEQGQHEALLSKGGYYARLWRLSSRQAEPRLAAH